MYFLKLAITAAAVQDTDTTTYRIAPLCRLKLVMSLCFFDINASSKVFWFQHCRGHKLSCVSAHFDKYVDSSLFNFIIKSSSKKGKADKHSISVAVGSMLLTFLSEKSRAALITLRPWFTLITCKMVACWSGSCAL